MSQRESTCLFQSNSDGQNRQLGQVEADEFSTMLLLQELHDAQTTYASRYKTGFAASLSLFGPAPKWYHPTAEHAGLLDSIGSGPGDDGTHLTRSGYVVTYTPGAAGEEGKIATDTFFVRPAKFGVTGVRSFFMDDSGEIHATDVDRPATLHDAAVTN